MGLGKTAFGYMWGIVLYSLAMKRRLIAAACAVGITFLSGGFVFAHGEETPPGDTHLATQIGLPDAKAGHEHGSTEGHTGEEATGHDTGGHTGDDHGGGADMSANFNVRMFPEGPYAVGIPITLRISFHEKAAGMQIKNFEITHEKQLHLIMVSSDLEEFYHEHPQYQPDGTFVLKNFTFPRQLQYTLFFDLKPVGTQGILLKKELVVGKGLATPPFLKPSQFPVTIGKIRMDLKSTPSTLKSGEDTELVFRLNDVSIGAPLNDIEPYLTAPAHLVVLSEASLDYLHMHPLGDIPEDPAKLAAMRFGPNISFAATFPKAGSYKGWLQLKQAGVVTTIPFIVDVAPGEESMTQHDDDHDTNMNMMQNAATRGEVARLVHTTQQQEEFRSVMKFLSLALLIFGMIMLFYPKKPTQVAQPAQQPTIEPAKTI